MAVELVLMRSGTIECSRWTVREFSQLNYWAVQRYREVWVTTSLITMTLNLAADSVGHMHYEHSGTDDTFTSDCTLLRTVHTTLWYSESSSTSGNIFD